MKAILLPLLVLVAVGSLAKADTLDYKYTWHIDSVVLPDGIRLPSIELAFLAAHDLFFGPPPAIYDYHETGNTVVPLYLRESVSPSSPNYINPFTDFSRFQVGGGDDQIVDESFMGGNVAGYDTLGTSSGLIETGHGAIYGFFNSFEPADGALTTDTLRLDIVPEPRAASLLALGLVGIAGLALLRKRHPRLDA